MDTTGGRDRLREFVDLIVSSLDDEVDGATIASRAGLSRYHFDRLVSAAMGESPGSFRRRLLLERAAWELRGSRATITRVAFDAGYLSPEGFTRAFARAFGCTPGRFRRQPGDFRLPAPNGVHFHPPGGLAVPADQRRSRHMDLVDRIIGHDIWFTQRLLDRAADLPSEALDRPIVSMWQLENRQPLRAILGALVSTRENWAATLAGRDAPPEADGSLDSLRQRFDQASTELVALVRGIRDRGEWDAGFVDALCDPPESFTYGGMLAHVITFSAYRRTMAVVALRALGVEDVGLGDPIEWERSLT